MRSISFNFEESVQPPVQQQMDVDQYYHKQTSDILPSSQSFTTTQSITNQSNSVLTPNFINEQSNFNNNNKMSFTQYLQNQNYISQEKVKKYMILSQCSQNTTNSFSFSYNIIQDILSTEELENYIQDQKYGLAIEQLKRIENSFSENIENLNKLDGIHLLYYKFGQVYMKMKEYFLALDNYNTARSCVQNLYQNMDFPKIEYSLSLIYKSQNQIKLSIQHLMSGFDVQCDYKGEKNQENLVVCKRIIDNLKFMENSDKYLVIYCRKYIAIAQANGYYENAEQQLDYYSILKCLAKILMKLKQYSEGIKLLEESLDKLESDYINIDNQQLYVYEISKIWVAFYKNKVEYTKCEHMYEILIKLSAQIFGENSQNTADLLYDQGQLQNVLLQNQKSLQNLKKAYQIYKNNGTDESNIQLQKIISSIKTVTQDLHNQNAIQNKMKQYDYRNPQVVIKIMEEFNRIGKLYAKRGQIQKSVKNYEMSHILFHELPQNVKEDEEIKKLENKLLLNYAVLQIQQNEVVIALIFLNQINEQQQITENQNEEQQQIIEQDNFQLFYRKGICYEKINENLLGLENFVKAYQKLKNNQELKQKNQEKFNEIQKKIETYSLQYNINIDQIL